MSKLSAASAVAILAIAGILVYRFIQGPADHPVDAGKTAVPSSIEQPPQQTAVISPVEGEVFADGRLAGGLDMGVNSERGCTDWVTPDADGLKLAWPGGPRCGSWGADFMTVGHPTDLNKPSRDYFQYSTLEVEIRGEKGGEQVDVGVKDWKQKPDGQERKASITVSKDWKTHKIRLSDLVPLNDPNRPRADLTHLYVICEFVFADVPQTVYVRRIRYSR